MIKYICQWKKVSYVSFLNENITACEKNLMNLKQINESTPASEKWYFSRSGVFSLTKEKRFTWARADEIWVKISILEVSWNLNLYYNIYKHKMMVIYRILYAGMQHMGI